MKPIIRLFFIFILSVLVLFNFFYGININLRNYHLKNKSTYEYVELIQLSLPQNEIASTQENYQIMKDSVTGEIIHEYNPLSYATGSAYQVENGLYNIEEYEYYIENMRITLDEEDSIYLDEYYVSYIPESIIDINFTFSDIDDYGLQQEEVIAGEMPTTINEVMISSSLATVLFNTTDYDSLIGETFELDVLGINPEDEGEEISTVDTSEYTIVGIYSVDPLLWSNFNFQKGIFQTNVYSQFPELEAYEYAEEFIAVSEQDPSNYPLPPIIVNETSCSNYTKYDCQTSTNLFSVERYVYLAFGSLLFIFGIVHLTRKFLSERFKYNKFSAYLICIFAATFIAILRTKMLLDYSHFAQIISPVILSVFSISIYLLLYYILKRLVKDGN